MLLLYQVFRYIEVLLVAFYAFATVVKSICQNTFLLVFCVRNYCLCYLINDR